MLAFLIVLLAMLAAVPSQAAMMGPYWDPDAPCYRWPAIDRDGDGVFDRIDHCPGTPKGCLVSHYGCELDADKDGVCDGIDECPATPPGAEVDARGCHAGAVVPKEMPDPAVSRRQTSRDPIPEEKVSKPVDPVERQLIEEGRIRLENVYFETASAVLLPESESALRQAGDVLERFPGLRIEVEGHTDTRGSNSYNMRLSQARAESVRDFLLAHFELDPDLIEARGYGETRPETRERNEEELLRNRRVVLRVLNPEALPRGVEVEND